MDQFNAKEKGIEKKVYFYSKKATLGRGSKSPFKKTEKGVNPASK
jgi:hypothetical protein